MYKSYSIYNDILIDKSTLVEELEMIKVDFLLYVWKALAIS